MVNSDGLKSRTASRSHLGRPPLEAYFQWPASRDDSSVSSAARSWLLRYQEAAGLASSSGVGALLQCGVLLQREGQGEATCGVHHVYRRVQ